MSKCICKYTKTARTQQKIRTVQLETRKVVSVPDNEPFDTRNQMYVTNSVDILLHVHQSIFKRLAVNSVMI